MSVTALSAYAALVFVLLSLPSDWMCGFARWQLQHRWSVRLAAMFGILVCRMICFLIALVTIVLFMRIMPDGITLAKMAAAAFLVIYLVRQLRRMKRPFPVAANDNSPEQNVLPALWNTMRAEFHPSAEIAVAAAAIILIAGTAAFGMASAISLSSVHLASCILSLLAYALLTRPMTGRIRHGKDQARKARVEKLLRTGLPRVSARYRQDAA